MPPTPEIFPGGSWERPWTAGEDDAKLESVYEAGGVYVTAEGEGDLAIELDGSALDPIAVTGAGLDAIAEHPKHERHVVAVRPSAGVRVWSVSFPAGVP